MAAYFAIPTVSAEYEAERIVDSVRNAFFHVDNLQGIGFLDSSGKTTLISDLTNRVADIMFLSFRSSIMASVINQLFPLTTSSLDFSLRLPQNVISTESAPASTLTSSIRTPPRTPEPASVQTPASRPSSAFALNNAIYDLLAAMDAS